jgi:hypothetical protein
MPPAHVRTAHRPVLAVASTVRRGGTGTCSGVAKRQEVAGRRARGNRVTRSTESAHPRSAAIRISGPNSTSHQRPDFRISTSYSSSSTCAGDWTCVDHDSGDVAEQPLAALPHRFKNRCHPEQGEPHISLRCSLLTLVASALARPTTFRGPVNQIWQPTGQLRQQWVW